MYINKLALRFVDRTAVADLEHVGRRTARVHHTPVRAFRRGNTVVIGLNFGRESDWARNVTTARRCRLRLRGQVMELTDPRIVPIGQGMKSMPKLFGFGLRYLVRTRDCLELSVRSSVSAQQDGRPGTKVPPAGADRSCPRTGGGASLEV